MVYYIIDVRFPKAFKRSVQLRVQTATDPSKSSIEDFEIDYLYHFVYPNQPIKTIVCDTKRFILNAKLGAQSVDMIRLCGHGDSGKLQFGEGLNESNAAAFRELAVFMKPDLNRIGVEIHGCGVGSDTSIVGAGSTINNPVCVPGSTQNGNRGLNFLKKLAKAINRNVKAGLNCQTVYNSNDDWRFEGMTITVKPDGNSWLSQ
jgi:hypothetical protein